MTINNGTLAMADVQNYDNALWNLIVPAGATARLEADGRCTLSGSLTGAGTLTFYTPFIRTDLRGNWSAFTGQILALGEFRIGNSFGYGNAALDLAAGVAAAYIDNPPTTGRTIDIGELSGAATSMLKGGPTSGRTVTYRIGGRNTSSTFAGEIRDGTGPTALTKLGTGTLTLTGASTYTGATTVQAGKLKILGSIASSSSLTVAAGATVEMSGTASTSFTGTLTNNGLMRLYDATTISTTGTFINNGTLDLINFSGTLPANLQNNGIILVAASVKVLSSTRSGSTFNLRVLCYPGHTYTLQTTTNLSGASWTDVTGTEYSPTADTEHVFVDSAPGTNARFYRVRVEPY